MNLTSYRTLGRSGLAVSPMALGAATFGQAGWGAGEVESRAIFDRYVDAGGNFIDTANWYADGNSETLLGQFIRESGSRDRIVLSTKVGGPAGDYPNGSGLGAKHIWTELETSLRRLRTDYVDLYWLHIWDCTTPMEEVLQTMSALVRAGKIRYWGLSNTPAWIVAQLATLAAARGEPRPIGLQYEYSLIERSVEADLIPLAFEAGMGMVAWSPLGSGFLTGKYKRGGGPDGFRPVAGAGDGRLSGENPVTNMSFSARNWMIADILCAVAEEIGTGAAQTALAWLVRRPGVTAPILGVRDAGQLVAAFEALRLPLDPAIIDRLDEATSPLLTYPATLYRPRATPRPAGSRETIRGWQEQWRR
jgi:aryl-alcohol dehydrogenase-like predicted oxidoreductase